MVSNILSTEARHFCQTTSVRGIPRIVNSKSIVHSVIWFLGVLTCASVLVWQVVVLTMRFLSYPVNTAINQSPQGDSATFPDITICNLCPLVYEDEMPLSYTDYLLMFDKQYTLKDYQNAYRLFESDVNTTQAISYLQYIASVLASPSGYFLNFPLTDNNTNIRKDSPILGCSYFNWDYSPHALNDCVGSIQEIWDPYYYKCFTLKINDTLRKSTRGFSAIIYVEDILENAWSNYYLDLRDTRAKGIKVLIHEPGTKPDMKLAVGIETGKSSTITLQQKKITRLPEPYSNCTSVLPLELYDESSMYTQSFCNDVCLQEQYLQHCGCLASVYMFTDGQQRRANNSMCGVIGITNVNSSFNWKGVEQILCGSSFILNTTICSNLCPLACEELHYEPRVTANSWPHVTSQLSFYATYIHGNSRFGDKYDQYFTDYTYNFVNRSLALGITEKLDKEGLISDNFLQLNVQFNSKAYQLESNVVAFSTDAFGAQLGGVLSLWLGVTIILVFEVCEFIISLLSSIWAVQRNQQATVK